MSRINTMSPVLSRPLPHDTAMLCALRAVLTMAFLGLSGEWLATQPAFSWEIWIPVSQVRRRTASGPAVENHPVGSVVSGCLTREFRGEVSLTRSG